MSTRSRKKPETTKVKIKDDEKTNGKSTGPLSVRLDSCLNCETPLGNGTTKVAEFMLSFSETSKRTFSVLEALTSIFELSSANSKLFPMLTSKNLVMCPSCATVLANLYKSYVELMQLSRPSANICKLVTKAEKWHDGKKEFLTTNASSEDDEDEDDEDESESEVDMKKVKREPMSDDGEGGDEEEDDMDMEYITPNGTRKKLPARNAGKSRKKRKASRNGDYDYDEGSDEDYREPRSKRKSSTKSSGASGKGGGSGCVDRSRMRERISLALDGTPRKRIRRRPSQTREDDYKCLECDRIFKFECRLIKHMKTHVDKQRTQCHICNQSFLYSWMLENHVLSQHDHVKPKVCGVCDLTFYRNDIYDNHFCTPRDQQQAERDEKPHRCQLCGKAFQKLAHLTLHLRSHEDEKPLTCPNCSQKFKYEKCLMKHMVVHNTDHICPLCQKVFPLKSKLNNHMQTHDVDKIYNCPIASCNKVFKQSTALQRHVKSHSAGENPEADESGGGAPNERFGCDSCSKSFSRKADLSRHVRNAVCRKLSTKSEGEKDESSDDDDDQDEVEGQASDGGDSMSPGVSNSDNENALPLSPSPPASPQLNLSEEDSNPPPSANKTPSEGVVLGTKSVPVLESPAEDSFLSDKDSN